MGFLLAGLLQGAGAGFTQVAAQKREDAMIALRRQYQQEDTLASNTREDQKDKRDSELKVGLLSLANEYKLKEGETEFERTKRIKILESDLQAGRDASKYKYDAALQQGSARWDMAKDAASKRLANDLEKGLIQGTEAAPDGSMIVIYKDGRRVVDPTVKVREKRSGSGDDEESGPIAAARARREGTLSPKPKGVASAAPANAAALRAEAQAAINSGAPRAAVEKRFREMTGQAL